ncbi:hypothetical protein REPUB_Repub06bG0027300 [Reevesia pubescens]
MSFLTYQDILRLNNCEFKSQLSKFKALGITFVPPQPVKPFLNPLGYTVEPFRGMLLFNPAPRPGMIMPGPELPLPTLLLHQIDYYFSDANLVKDEFLKSNMDDQGWVAISLIAGFPRAPSHSHHSQGSFLDLQFDRKENRSIDVAVLEEQVHQILRQWKANNWL